MTATCPSCGHGLVLAETAGQPELVPPKVVGPGGPHVLIR